MISPPPAYDSAQPTNGDGGKDSKAGVGQENQEEKFRNLVEQLNGAISSYKTMRRRRGGFNNQRLKEQEANILKLMHGVAEAASDPSVKQHYHEKAGKFAKANRREKENIAKDVGKGLVTLLTAPFAIAGATLVVVGNVLYGVGGIIKGMGNAMGMGFLDSWKMTKNEDWDSD